MPVPSSMGDLSVTEASNSPNGSDAIGTGLDNYLRAIQAILRSTNHKAADIASGASVAIGAATGQFLTVTGTTTITSFDSVSAGIVRTVVFSGILTLTHSTNIQLPGSANYTTAAGDVLTFLSLGSGQWKCINIVNANAVTPIPTVTQTTWGAYKTTSTSRSSTTTISDDPHLVVSGLDAGTYAVRALLRVTCAANSVNIKYNITNGVLTAGYRAITLTTPQLDESGIFAGSGSSIVATVVSADSTAVYIDGTATLASTGSIAIGWAQNSSSATPIVVQANSHMTLIKLS